MKCNLSNQTRREAEKPTLKKARRQMNLAWAQLKAKLKNLRRLQIHQPASDLLQKLKRCKMKTTYHLTKTWPVISISLNWPIKRSNTYRTLSSIKMAPILTWTIQSNTRKPERDFKTENQLSEVAIEKRHTKRL
jgi:hypothetical protein